ncbi:hypothetical protein [Spirosoma utsteinense]|uniref:Uncharacterized protein n=1 Tax=Spirosoma utsteinense TaxID=2585773 RepID=A0ABR6VZC2_9BACT|nr:hypothetical protein [Spirosoma utsteinense]MBC3784688.1 hypothetical protein [Spirosoma utsteinense]MBC3789558.1 hypothetical protein [Spirosoma utsteinense]
MKTFPNILICAGLLSLLITAPLSAMDTTSKTDRNLPITGWVSAPDASFNARTYQADNGDLVIQVNNRSLRVLTIQMQTMRGEEIAFVPVPKQQSAFGTRLNVQELADGDYRIIVSSDNERIVNIINLKLAVPTPAVRRATVAVVNPVNEP